MYKKLKTPRKERHIKIVEFFLFANAPVFEPDFFGEFDADGETILNDLAVLRKYGIDISSKRGYYELRNRVTVEQILKLTSISERLFEWMGKNKKTKNE